MELKGNIPVIPTPFINGALDTRSFARLIERTHEELDGYVVCGSTGEAPALSTSERKELTRFITGMGLHDKQIVVGLGHTSLTDAVEIGDHAAELGITAALVPSPYYFPNTLSMVIDYVGTLAEKTGLDIVLYDNPVTTKTHFSFEQLQEIIRSVPRVKAIKMTDHDMGKIRSLKEQTTAAVFGGDDIICFRAFEAGVDGNMIIAPVVYPEKFKECWDLYQAGNREESFRVYCDFLLPFISMFGPGDEIPTTKALFHRLGIYDSPETRTPLLAATSARLKEVMLGYEQGISSTRP